MRQEKTIRIAITRTISAKAAAVLFAFAVIFTLPVPASAEPLKLVALISDLRLPAAPATIDPVTGVIAPLGTASLPDFRPGPGTQFTTLVTNGTHAYFAKTANTSDWTNSFYSLDLGTGALSSVVDSSGFITGLGWDSVHSQLLALVAVGPTASFANIDPVSGVLTPLGTATLPGYGLFAGTQFTTLVTNGTHAYFAGTASMAGRTSSFYSLDLTTGALSSITDSGGADGLINGLGWDSVHGQVLALVSDGSSTASIADIDPVTCVITPLGTASLPGYGPEPGNQFTTLLADGTHAYFAGSASAAGRSTSFYSLDLTTGALNSITGGPTGSLLIDALGIVPETSGSTVPEPASWVLIIAGLGLVGIALRGSRRQRRRMSFFSA